MKAKCWNCWKCWNLQCFFGGSTWLAGWLFGWLAGFLDGLAVCQQDRAWLVKYGHVLQGSVVSKARGLADDHTIIKASRNGALVLTKHTQIQPSGEKEKGAFLRSLILSNGVSEPPPP